MSRRLSQRAKLDRARARDEAAAAAFHRELDFRLTGRETDVLRAAAGGLTQRETAAMLGIGYETVRTYTRNARLALGVRTTAQAVGAAKDRGLI